MTENDKQHEPASACDLSSERCVACEGGVPVLTQEDIDGLLPSLGQGWRAVEGHHLACRYEFPNFKKALAFTNRVGELAEEEGHHPDITVGWGKAEITLWTHAVDGLTRNDFILAAKISDLSR